VSYMIYVMGMLTVLGKEMEFYEVAKFRHHIFRLEMKPIVSCG
jgi:hypothetical protein